MNSVFGVKYIHVFCLYLYLFVGHSKSENVITRNEGDKVTLPCHTFLNKNQTWIQTYTNAKSVITLIPDLYALKNTIFAMNLERFDNNTEVNCLTNNIHLANIFNAMNKKFRIQVLKSTNLSQTEDFEIQHFSLDQNVTFSCRDYVGETNKTVLDTRIGLINMTSNKIQTFETTWAKRTFSMKYNRTAMLCCIQYQVQRTRDEVTITRYVRKKTLLVYDENYRYHNDQEAWINMEDGQQTYIYIISAVALIVLLLIFILVIIYRKCWHKRNGNRTNGMNSRVLYADLDLQTQGSPPQRPIKEESPYACIIGELGIGSKPKK